MNFDNAELVSFLGVYSIQLDFQNFLFFFHLVNSKMVKTLYDVGGEPKTEYSFLWMVDYLLRCCRYCSYFIGIGCVDITGTRNDLGRLGNPIG